MNFKSILDPEKNEDINYINFNQDFSCFTVGTENGYKVFNTLPLLELKNFENSSETTTTPNSSNTNFQNDITEHSNSSNNNSRRNSNNSTKSNSSIQNNSKVNSSLTQSFKNLNLRNGSFQQKLKTNSILEARKNLKARMGITTNINNNSNNYNSRSNNNNNSNNNSNNTNNTKLPNIHSCPGLIIVEGLYHSNLLAIVGKDINSYFSPNKVFLCDMSKDTVIAEIQYEVEVKAVRITEYGLIVVLPTQTFIYDGHVHPKCIHKIETCYNEKGLVAVATIKKKDRNGITIVLPGKTQGEIQLLNLQYKEKPTIDGTVEMVTTPVTPTPATYINDRIRRSMMTGASSNISTNTNFSSNANANSIIPTFSKIRAHKSTLSCLAISLNGELVASASEQGTIIRIFNLETRQKVHEFRRGTDKAQIYSINFNKNCTKICVSSNKGTIHIFNLDENSSLYALQQQQQLNDLDRNSLGYPDAYSTTTMTHYEKKHLQQQQQQPLSIYSLSQKIVPKYFIERSWAQFRLPLSNICTFVDTFSSPTTTTSSGNEKSEPSNKVELIALCSNGYVYRFTCITTVKTSNVNGGGSGSSKYEDPMANLRQSHRIQKKKFFITKNEESEDEDDEDNDIIENFYNEDYIKNSEISYE